MQPAAVDHGISLIHCLAQGSVNSASMTWVIKEPVPALGHNASEPYLVEVALGIDFLETDVCGGYFLAGLLYARTPGLDIDYIGRPPLLR
jgi:hypothetical protein